MLLWGRQRIGGIERAVHEAVELVLNLGIHNNGWIEHFLVIAGKVIMQVIYDTNSKRIISTDSFNFLNNFAYIGIRSVIS